MESEIIFGQMIDYLRRQKNWSMERFGEEFGKNKSTVSRWINGTRFPTIPEAEAIAEYFNIPFQILIFGAKSQDDLLTSYLKLEEYNQQKVINFVDHLLNKQEKIIKIQEPSDLYEYRDLLASNEFNGELVAEETSSYYAPQIITIQSKLSAGTGIIDLDPEYAEEIEFNGYIPKHDLAFWVDGDSMEPTFGDGEIVFVERTPDIHNGQFIAVQINEEAYIKKAYIENDRLKLVSLNKNYKDIVANGNDDIRVIGRVIL